MATPKRLQVEIKQNGSSLTVYLYVKDELFPSTSFGEVNREFSKP